MLDEDWINKLKPEEAAAALKSLDSFGAMTPKEATVIHRWQRALKAKALSGIKRISSQKCV